jgi:hypothetical protein
MSYEHEFINPKYQVILFIILRVFAHKKVNLFERSDTNQLNILTADSSPNVPVNPGRYLWNGFSNQSELVIVNHLSLYIPVCPIKIH